MMPARVLWTSQWQTVSAASQKKVFDQGIPTSRTVALFVEIQGGSAGNTFASGGLEEITYKTGSDPIVQLSWLEHQALQAAYGKENEESGGKKAILFPMWFLPGRSWEERFSCQVPSDNPTVELQFGALVAGSPQVRIHAVQAHPSIPRQMTMKCLPFGTTIVAAPSSGQLLSRDLQWQGEMRALIMPEQGINKLELIINNDRLITMGDTTTVPDADIWQVFQRALNLGNPNDSYSGSPYDKVVLPVGGVGLGNRGFIRNAALQNQWNVNLGTGFDYSNAYSNRLHILEYFGAPDSVPIKQSA